MILLVGMLPWSALYVLVGNHFKERRDDYLFLLAWIVAVFFIFQKAHSKLASYILPLWPALATVLALSLNSLERLKQKARWVGWIHCVLGLVLLGGLWYGLKMYAPLVTGGLVAGFLLFVLGMVSSGFCWFRHRYDLALTLNGFGFVLFLLVVCLALPKTLKNNFSDSDLPAVVQNLTYQHQPILASKMYVRGVYFYTHNPVVVVNAEVNPFWSPHPLEVLSSAPALQAFFDGKDKVLYVVTQKDYAWLKELGFKRRQTILSQNLNRYVVLSTKM